MTRGDLSAEEVTVGGLFGGGAEYVIPVYQRNYAWGEEQIERMIIDIRDSMGAVPGESGSEYFLGNLITKQVGSAFEVIDGQQRLTTLYMLLTVLPQDGATRNDSHVGRLRYQSRRRASEALRRIDEESFASAALDVQGATDEDAAILRGCNVINQRIAPEERDDFAKFLRERVKLVRVNLPDDTDLNRYFEVMNTRGVQLSQVDIVKADLMSRLGDDADRACFAWIWDACADMNVYLQMALKRGNTKLPDGLFDADEGTWLKTLSFDELKGLRQGQASGADGSGVQPDGHPTLAEALTRYAGIDASKTSKQDASERFRSTIEFPVFLLHVLKIPKGEPPAAGQAGLDSDRTLDDKQLVDRFRKAFPKDSGGSSDRGSEVKEFAERLVLCRNLFDAYVLKRTYTGSGDDGEWSLKRFAKVPSGGEGTRSRYVPTFKDASSGEGDETVDSGTRQVLLLQSMLRVTYTAPSSMHWITELLRHLVNGYDSGRRPPTDEESIVALLRNHARKKVEEAFFDRGETPTGFDIKRIVFTYLDFLLVEKDAAEWRHFRFAFRSSIEHFSPQHPNEQMDGERLTDDCLHSLGNLALVSVGANSKFGNSVPKAKSENFKQTILGQSPKLSLMAEMTRDKGWKEAQVFEHHNEMVRLLAADLFGQSGEDKAKRRLLPVPEDDAALEATEEDAKPAT